MGKIAKAYRTIIRDGAIIQASDAIRAFDDLYDEFNGNLDTQNFSIDVTIDSSKVTVDNIGISATELQAAILEKLYFKDRGHNDIHFFSDASRGVNVFPGSVEVNNIICVVTDRFLISRSNLVLVDDTTPVGSSTVYGITVPAVAVLTASDFQLVLLSDLSSTNGTIDVDKMGVYASSETFNTNSRRVLMSMHYKNTQAGSYSVADGEFMTPPNRGHRYDLTVTEMSGLGVVNINSTAVTATSFSTTGTTRFYDFKTNNYRYLLSGYMHTTTGAHTFINGINNEYEDWRIDNFMITNDSGGPTDEGMHHVELCARSAAQNYFGRGLSMDNRIIVDTFTTQAKWFNLGIRKNKPRNRVRS